MAEEEPQTISLVALLGEFRNETSPRVKLNKLIELNVQMNKREYTLEERNALVDARIMNVLLRTLSARAPERLIDEQLIRLYHNHVLLTVLVLFGDTYSQEDVMASFLAIGGHQTVLDAMERFPNDIMLLESGVFIFEELLNRFDRWACDPVSAETLERALVTLRDVRAVPTEEASANLYHSSCRFIESCFSKGVFSDESNLWESSLSYVMQGFVAFHDTEGFIGIDVMSVLLGDNNERGVRYIDEFIKNQDDDYPFRFLFVGRDE